MECQKAETRHVVLFASSQLHLLPCRAMSVANLKAVVEKVRQQEEEDLVQPWSEIASTASVIPEEEMPHPGKILPDVKEFPYVGAKELTCSNGMKVGGPLRLDFIALHAHTRGDESALFISKLTGEYADLV